MLAAEQDQAEQELPKSICQPRHVRLFVLVLNADSLLNKRRGRQLAALLLSLRHHTAFMNLMTDGLSLVARIQAFDQPCAAPSSTGRSSKGCSAHR